MTTELTIAPFRVDITPPVGHPLCAGWYPAATGIEDPLYANGVVLQPAGASPIVLCALDWAELSNGDYDMWRDRLAEAAGTSGERVAVHCTHCHDAPWPDREAQALLDEQGLPGFIMDVEWCDGAMNAVTRAVVSASSALQPVTEIRAGRARVSDVASNSRVMGPDGKVKGVRWTRCRDAALRAEPEGLIDPWLKTIRFLQNDRLVVALDFYSVHPTSHDGTGRVTREFVGLARDRMADEDGAPHIYFTECAGNITTGKFNDGEGDYRERFAARILEAMRASALSARTVEVPFVDWRSVPVTLPVRADQPARLLLEEISNLKLEPETRSRAALILAYQNRVAAGRRIDISALHLGPNLVTLHTPGEMFIEYQLFAQSLRPRALVAAPSYGDCGPGYIPLARSYDEGGYEPRDAFCSVESEDILRRAITQVLG